ncbi:MAG: murein biosynthesis integral membrane protein MurJ [Bacteroidota bacterium]
MTTPSATRQIARAAGTVMFAILLGQLAGLLRSILVARIFGASHELDAFLLANRVSETLFLLVAGGALGSAFIPAFTGLLVRDEKDSAWRLASHIANTITLVMTLLAALAALLAPQIVRYLIAPGFAGDPALFALTVSLLRVQLISPVLFGLGGLVVGILNAHQIFFVPALTPALYQLGIILGALFLAPSMGVYGLAWGVVLGAALYLFLQVPALPKLRGSYTPGLGLANPSVRQVIALMGPRLLGVAVVQLNFWVNGWLASQMSEGSYTGLYYGFSLMLMAQAAIAQSVAIAAMPTFSAQHALGRLADLRDALAASLRGVILLAVPASVGLILLRAPLVSLLFERGSFDERSAALVSWALLWYAAGLVGHSIMEVLTRAFYAQQDTKTPVLIGMAAMTLNVVLSFALSAAFRRIGWMPHGGLALANSLATALEAAALFIVMRNRLQGIQGLHVLRGFGAAALAALAMALGLALWTQASAGMSRWVVAPVGVAAGALVYALAVWALRLPEVQLLTRTVRSRLRRTS